MATDPARRAACPRLAPLLLFGSTVACASVTEIGALEPRPGMAELGPTDAYRLAIAASVQDAFDVPGLGRTPSARVTAWKQSLGRAFENAMGDRARPAIDGELGAAFVLRIERADLVLVSEDRVREQHRGREARLAWAGPDDRLPVILAHGSHAHPKAPAPPMPAVYAQISYAATLLDANGRAVRRASGTVLSARSARRSAWLSAVVQNALELAFQRIMSELRQAEAPIQAITGP